MQPTHFPAVFDVLESRYAPDDVVHIECSGWAPYVEKKGVCAAWSETFEFPADGWADGSVMLGDFRLEEDRDDKGEIDMEHAMTSKISIRIADDEFSREYECGEQPGVIDLDGSVADILLADIRRF